MASIVLPPFGNFGGKYFRFIDEPPMSDWLPGDPDRLPKFYAVRDQLLNDCYEKLCPRYDKTSRTWEGRSADWATDFVDFELQVMIRELQAPPGALSRLIESPNLGTPRTHHAYFEIEDDVKAPLCAHLVDYDKTLSPAELARAEAVGSGAFATKIPGLFYMKDKFQRPRPWQTALLLGRPEFRYEYAATAAHSACYSGHTLEALTFCAAIYVEWLSTAAPSPTRVASLAQFAVDYGDRRTMAGVHYPSDSIASWLVAMVVVPRLFPGFEPQVQEFIARAVKEHSSIYALISRVYRAERLCAPAVELMDAAIPP